MVRKQKKVVKEEREEEQEAQRSVILLSSSDDDEANEDLSLEIVERARMREAKRKRDEDFEGFRASAGSGSVVVVDLSSTSSEENEFRGGGGGVGAKGLAGVADGKRKRRKKKKKNATMKIEDGEEKTSDVVAPLEQVETIVPVVAAAVDAVEAEVVNPVGEVSTSKLEETGKETDGVVDNTVMRKLLRGPRYFDSPDCFLETCYNCDEVGHRAANCTAKKRKKPCFVCGSLEHGARNCKEGVECFICKKKGHRRKDCPEKDQRIAKNSKICLRCGNLGHDMFFCSNDYAPEDLKEIKCYMCGKAGHLCCIDYVDTNPGKISCYNCGQAGHYGLGCASARGETSTTSVTVSATVCYRCGEEGHYARGCSQKLKLVHGVGESSVPMKPKKVSKSAKNKLVYSAPPDLKKAHKKKVVRLEEKPVTPAKKSKQRGGWITDDPVDLPNRTPKKVNNWSSPATPPTRANHVGPNITIGGYIPNSHSWARPRFQPATPPSTCYAARPYVASPNGPANPYQYQYQPRYSASRFANGSNSSTPYQYHW